MISSAECCGCRACEAVCSQNAIKFEADKEGFLYPAINQEACIGCGSCDSVCPIKVGLSCASLPRKAYGLVASDENILLRGSSGGAFGLIASAFQKEGGYVVGCQFNEAFEAVHVVKSPEDSLNGLYKSKYVQSNLVGIFSEIKNLLNRDNMVLFSGTPCQVQAIKSFLGKEYKNFYTVDLACHGVPSPKVWKKYVNSVEEKTGKRVKKVYFRWKDNEGRYQSADYLLLLLEDDSCILENRSSYLEAFLRDYSLRPSCYDCKFKGTKRVSDITLADFWGYESCTDKFGPDESVSLVLLNTDRGMDLFRHINTSANALCCEVEVVKAIHMNGRMIKSPACPRRRSKFFDNLDTFSLEELVRRYVNPHKKLKDFVKFFLKLLKLR